MVRLKLLGSLGLELRDQARARSVLAQPKRVAILAYLAVAHPGELRRRDELLGLFWPERDNEHARNALRQAIYFLSTNLGDGVLVRRGREEIGLGAGAVDSDVWAFERALESGRPDRAVELYGGALLEGFHVREAGGFEDWLDVRREALRRAAVKAALTCGNQALGERRWADGVDILCKARRWAPYDEEVLRLQLQGLWLGGDRAAAVQELETFATRLDDDLGLEASFETRSLLGQLEEEDAPTRDRLLYRLASGAAKTSTDRGEPSAPAGSELSAEGSERGKGGNARRCLRPLFSTLAALFVVGSLVYGGLKLHRTERPPRIAALPLQNLSPDPENAYIAAGLHEEILHQLTRITDVQVLGRTSVARYGSAQGTPAEVARELRAEFILQGSVQRDGDRVRVIVQLVDGGSGEHLWAERYDRDLPGVFGVQTDVAVQVARRLQVALRPETPGEWTPSTSDLEASTAFWQGHYHLQRHWSVDHARRAVASYRRAVSLDSTFAAAWARLAWAHLWLATQHRESQDLASARVALHRAEALAPRSLEARKARGAYLYRTGRYEEGLRIFEGLEETFPGNADVLLNLAALQRAVGRWEESRETFVQALTIDPVNPGLAAEVGMIHRMTGRLDEAHRYLELAVSLDPSIAQHWWFLAGVYLWEGATATARAVLDSAAHHVDPVELLGQRANVDVFEGRSDAALDLLLDAPADHGWWRARHLAEVAYRAGRLELVREHADSLRVLAMRSRERGARRFITEMQLATAHAYLGNREEAWRHAEAAGSLVDHALATSQVRRDIAIIYVVTGRHEEAVTILRDLLLRPGDDLSPAILDLDPIWDPLRHRSDFRALLDEAG